MEPAKPAPGGASPPASPAANSAPPTVDSVAFARRGEAVAGRMAIASMPRLLSAGVEARGTLSWEIEGFVARDQLQRQREFLRVRSTFSPWMTCSKCLEPVAVAELHSDTRFRFAVSESQAAAEDREAEEEEVIAASPHLDLAALVEDEAILALPMAPAHPGCDWQSEVGSRPGDDV